MANLIAADNREIVWEGGEPAKVPNTCDIDVPGSRLRPPDSLALLISIGTRRSPVSCMLSGPALVGKSNGIRIPFGGGLLCRGQIGRSHG